MRSKERGLVISRHSVSGRMTDFNAWRRLLLVVLIGLFLLAASVSALILAENYPDDGSAPAGSASGYYALNGTQWSAQTFNYTSGAGQYCAQTITVKIYNFASGLDVYDIYSHSFLVNTYISGGVWYPNISSVLRMHNQSHTFIESSQIASEIINNATDNLLIFNLSNAGNVSGITLNDSQGYAFYVTGNATGTGRWIDYEGTSNYSKGREMWTANNGTGFTDLGTGYTAWFYMNGTNGSCAPLGAAPGITVTQLAPADAYHTNNATVMLSFNVSGTDMIVPYVNCSLILNGSIVNTTTNMALNVSSTSFNVSLNETSYNWSVTCGSDGASSATTVNRSIVVDFTSPAVNYNHDSMVNLTNGTVFNWLNMTRFDTDTYTTTSTKMVVVNTTATDTYLYAYNRTLSWCDNGTVIETTQTTGLVVTSQNLTTKYRIPRYLLDGRVNNCFNVSEAWSDDHTARRVPDYQVTKKKSSVTFKPGNENNIKIETLEPSTIDAVKSLDRYSFTMSFDDGLTKNRVFDVKTDLCPLSYRNLSTYRAHFVSSCGVDGNWVDFEGPGGFASITKIDDYHYRVSIPNVPPVVTFSSIGGLNVVNTSTTFNVTLVPQQITDLITFAVNATSATLTYTLNGVTENVTNTTEVGPGTSSFVIGNTLWLNTTETLGSVMSNLAVYHSDGIRNSCVKPQLNFSNGSMVNLSEQCAHNNWNVWDVSSYSNVSAVKAWVRTSDGCCIMNAGPLYLNYSLYNSVLVNGSGTILYNGTNESVSVTSSPLTPLTYYQFYALMGYGNSVLNGLWYNTTQTLGENYLNFSTLSNGSITFTFVDEETFSTIAGRNITLDLIVFDVVSDTYSTTTGTINIVNISSNNYTFRYSTTGYGTRFYFAELDNASVISTTLYMLNDTHGTNVTVTVRDEVGATVEGVQVYVYKYNVATNSFFLTQICSTNFEGQCVADLELNSEYYKFMVYMDGVLMFASQATYVFTDSIAFTIITGGDGFSNYFSVAGVSGVVAASSALSRTFTFYDADARATQGCIRLSYYNTSGDNLISDNCTNSSTGVVSLSVPNVTGAMYAVTGVVTKDGSEFYVDGVLVRFRDEVSTGTAGYFLLLLLMLVAVGIAYFQMELGIISLAVMLLFAAFTGLFNVSLGAVGFIGVLGLVIVVVIGLVRR